MHVSTLDVVENPPVATQPGAPVAIALGGNLGDVSAAFRFSVATLVGKGLLLEPRVSSLYETAPIGDERSPRYLNAVISGRTLAPPEELLHRLHELEHECGRVRDQRWAGRTLDLDLLRYADLESRRPELWLPHPCSWWRRFVLDPWSEVEGHWLHPGFGVTVDELRSALTPRPLPVGYRFLSDVSPAERLVWLDLTRSAIRPEEVDLVEHGAGAINFLVGSHASLTQQLEPLPARWWLAPLSVEHVHHAVNILRGALDAPEVIADGCEWLRTPDRR